MVGNDFRRRLCHKFLVAQFSLEPADFLFLLVLLLDDTVQGFLQIDPQRRGDDWRAGPRPRKTCRIMER